MKSETLERALKPLDDIDIRVANICYLANKYGDIDPKYLDEAVERGPKSSSIRIRWDVARLARSFGLQEADKLYSNLIDSLVGEGLYEFASIAALEIGLNSDAYRFLSKFIGFYGKEFYRLSLYKDYYRSGRGIRKDTEMGKLMQYYNTKLENKNVKRAVKNLGLTSEYKELKQLAKKVL